MSIKRVIAIIRSDVLAPLEERLKVLRVGGLTVSRVKGYGAYKNLFASDWMSEHAKIEIFIEEAEIDRLIETMREVGDTGTTGGGILAVLPVERFVHLSTGTTTPPRTSFD